MEEVADLRQQTAKDAETRGRGDAEKETAIPPLPMGEGGGEGSNTPPASEVEASTPSTRDSALSTQHSVLPVEPEQLRAELEEARARGLESHRRALLAENAGKVVPELVAGSTVEELERSVEVARRAFEAAKAVALAEISAQQVPAGNPVRRGPSLEGMSPLEKIAYGLKK